MANKTRPTVQLVVLANITAVIDRIIVIASPKRVLLVLKILSVNQPTDSVPNAPATGKLELYRLR